MVKRPDLKTFKKKALQDKKFKAEYETLRPEFDLICKFIKARKNARYSQEELAKRLNIQQPAVARLEKGGYSTTSVAKLSKVANALGYSIKISLEPKKQS